MSQNRVYATSYTSVACLVAAIQKLVPHAQIEQHLAAPVNLYDWHGKKRADLAHIVVRRKHIEDAANDWGFRVKPDGTIEAIVSDFDSSSLVGRWMQQLPDRYAIETARQNLVAKGYRLDQIREVETDDEIELTVTGVAQVAKGKVTGAKIAW